MDDTDAVTDPRTGAFTRNTHPFLLPLPLRAFPDTRSSLLKQGRRTVLDAHVDEGVLPLRICVPGRSRDIVLEYGGALQDTLAIVTEETAGLWRGINRW